VLDKERILAKIDETDSYLNELEAISPEDYEEYLNIEKKRACERLLQISIECVIDICSLFVAGLRLGLPAEEDDLFEKLRDADLITERMKEKLKRMKSFRNILVHRYGHVDDALVYKFLKNNTSDFEAFKSDILEKIAKKGD